MRDRSWSKVDAGIADSRLIEITEQDSGTATDIQDDGLVRPPMNIAGDQGITRGFAGIVQIIPLAFGEPAIPVQNWSITALPGISRTSDIQDLLLKLFRLCFRSRYRCPQICA